MVYKITKGSKNKFSLFYNLNNFKQFYQILIYGFFSSCFFFYNEKMKIDICLDLKCYEISTFPPEMMSGEFLMTIGYNLISPAITTFK